MCTAEHPQPQELNSLEYTGKGGGASVLSKSCLGKPGVIPGSACGAHRVCAYGCVSRCERSCSQLVNPL
jgi:hypothetical protein